jgi:hypothetical protein
VSEGGGPSRYSAADDARGGEARGGPEARPGGSSRARGERRGGPKRRGGPVNYPFFEFVTGNIDLGQLGSFGRIDFEPRLYGTPRPLERTSAGGAADLDDRYNWRTYGTAQRRDAGGSRVDDLLERVDTPYVEVPPRGRARPDDALPARRGGSSRGRAAFTLIDQVLSSGTNALMAFLVAKQVTASEFGAFGVAFAVFAVVIGFSRSVGTAPLGMRFSTATRGEFRRAASHATGTALSWGIAVGSLTAVVGLLLGGAPGRSLIAMGLVFPGVLAQDSWRYVFFAQGRPGASALNDALWGSVQCAAFLILIMRHTDSAVQYILVWGASAAVAAAVGAIQAGFVPNPAAALSWVREHREISGYLSAEFVTVQGALQLSTLLIGTIGTIEIVGALRGVQTLLGPTSVLAVGILSFAIPELRFRQKDMTAAQRMKAARLLSAVVTGAGVAWGMIFLFIPNRVGVALLGSTWPLTHHILFPTVVQQAGTAMMIGPACVLYSLGRARVTFRLHATQAPLLLVCSIVGLELGGALGTAWGYATAFWLLVPLSFILLRREVRAAEAERVDDEQRAREADGPGTGRPAAPVPEPGGTGDGRAADGFPERDPLDGVGEPLRYGRRLGGTPPEDSARPRVPGQSGGRPGAHRGGAS